ncbi:MAG: trigger factor [Acidimicrobiales bacterium]
MRSTAEVLEGNKVKLSVEVDEEELETAVQDTFKRLQRELSVPGFRPGKVPRRLIEVRLGGKAIREEVIRSALPDYYAQAVEEASLDTIAAPAIDITSGEEDGPLAFDAVVEIRPKVSIAGYEGLQVTISSPEASQEEIDAQIDRMRENFAELNDVDRAVLDGDVVTVDVEAAREGETIDDLSTTDFVYSVGSNMIAPGVDEAIVGAKAGDTVEVAADEAPGGSATLKVTVKQVREKLLPEPTDDWASDASEFDTVADLRADISKRMTGLRRLQARLELREKAVEALAALVQGDMPETLVQEATERLLAGFVRQLESRKISLDQYFEATGEDAESVFAQMKSQGESQVRADLALRALADAEALDVDDAELASEMSRLAEQSGQSVRDVARQVAEGAGLERLRSEVRYSKAVTWLVDHVEVIDEQGSPMDRALLVEHEDSSDDPGTAALPDEHAGDAPGGEAAEGGGTEEEEG